MDDKRSLILAVDAMGGDFAPDSVIAGVKMAEKKFPDVRFKIFGDEEKVRPYIEKYALNADRFDFVHTPDYVASDEKPSVAVRTGRKSSLWLANMAVRNGEADAVVSSGNTGALMAFSKLVLGTLPGIHRPAIVTILPTRSKECVMLDLGANAECSARNLVEFAVMGNAYSCAVLQSQNPTIGLLNIGSEEIKGRDEIREASQMLRESPLAGQFAGFVEADDIGKGTVDIVVSDGFTGNIALKAIEGTARLIVGLLKDVTVHSIISKLGFLLAIRSLKKLKKKMDPGRYNGAMLVGLKGISVKSHGGADAFGFANALGVAVNLVKNDLLGSISRQITELHFDEETGAAADESDK